MQKVRAFAPGVIMIIVSLVFLSQAFTMEKASITDPAGGSFLPALIAFVMMITGITVLFQERMKLKVEMSETHHKVIEAEAETPDYENTEMTMRQYSLILTYFIMIIIYVLLLSFIPFIVATFIFLSVSMFFLRGVSWKTNLIVSIVSIIVIDLVFSKLFHIIFP
ncbi:tripartite tricarboxylate transporter TctB family protein [Pseudogracilibacillus sp. SO30301A]|uniref:tripartite tricarboxylate transporter TctB family protein n=1 Tax=Pseudogracilibacillus sp. SO30301A TaxID=3098291 RepID=UPI00300DC192